jgi:WD40 repeat protein
MAESKQLLEGHIGIITSVVFSHDLEKLASASYDKNIRIWNTETGKCERVLEGHGDAVTSVVFSHDSKKLASASWDKTIRIWNGETGACEDTIPLDVYTNVLSFTFDEIGVVTDNGVFAFTGRQTSYTKPRVSSQPSETSALVCKDSIWVKTKGKDLLWLPPECRNGEVATAGNTVAIGCRSGRVILLGISVADIQ